MTGATTHHRMTEVERHLAAEVRAMTEGHSVRWDDAGRCFLVKSDTRDGVTYRLTVSAVVSASRRFVPLVVSCDCPAGVKARLQPAGLARCKHGARVMQRLEREGLARFDGTQNRFIASGTLRDAALADADEAPERDDPPVTVERAGHRARRKVTTDMDELAQQLKNSLA
mgnify:CR=1 FL=1